MSLNTPASSVSSPSFQALEALRSITTEGSEDKTMRTALLSHADLFVEQALAPRKNALRFEIDGAPFSASYAPEGTAATLTVWGTLGYLPYSVSSYEKREKLILILEGSRSLPTVRFGIDSAMRIVVGGRYVLNGPLTPIYVFEPLTRFLQEARPFMRLIGDFL